MSLRARLLRAREASQLTSAMFELTYSCELDCVFCYNDTERSGRRLALDDYQRLLAELVDLGCFFLTLTGGEPLNHPDFFAIGAEARRLGFVVRIKSHGARLYGETLRRLVDEVDPASVDVSLHGATAATHDRLTQRPGSFDAVLRAIDGLQRADIRIRVNAPLTRWNQHELEDMFALADARGFNLFVDAHLTPRDNGDQSPLDLQVTEEDRARLRQLLRDRAASFPAPVEDDAPLPKTKFHCGAGTSAVLVDPFGVVYPCVQWREAIGDLHQAPLRDIWAGEPTAQIRSANEAARTHAVANELRGYCPGAAARSQSRRSLAIIA